MNTDEHGFSSLPFGSTDCPLNVINSRCSIGPCARFLLPEDARKGLNYA